MCDLIDLNSPEKKGLLDPKLASPLIPTPTNAGTVDHNTGRSNLPTPLIIGKRDSLENNPFDMVLHKTTEYIQKKDDPFEVALEKALNGNHKNVTSRTGSVDLTTEHKRHGRITRMNKTFDESMMNEEIVSQKYSRNAPFTLMGHQNFKLDPSNANMPDHTLQTDDLNLFSSNNCNTPNIEIQNADLSILNQSVLNDTLLETSCEIRENPIKSVLQQRISKYTEIKTDPNQSVASNIRVPIVRISIPHDDKVFPCTVQSLNPISMSTMRSLRAGSMSRGSLSSVASINSIDFLNEGFWKSQSSGSSVFSMSNISSTPRLSSVSSITSSLLMQSDTTENRTFLESGSSEKTDDRRLSEPVNSLKETNCTVTLPMNSTISVSKLANTQESASNKLIDVDVFMPDENCSKEECRSSVSDTSSDSVFLEGSKINKSIYCEAKAVARRFEELALSSGSSVDDLITNNPLWVSELLPAFDEEDMVGNLIELPTSPNISSSNTKLRNTKDVDQTSCANNNENCAGSNKLEDKAIKDLESELIDPVAIERKVITTTLLLDLKKLIKNENNAEVNKLVENLEKALGVECKNNTELLATCLNTTNNLAKSPKKINDDLEIIKNVKDVPMEESKEDNLTVALVENIKEPVFCEDVNLNNSNLGKRSENGEKYLNGMKGEPINVESETRINTDNSTNKKSDVEKNSKLNTTNTPEKHSNFVSATNSDSSNEKLAMELLTNLGKLLNGQTEQQSTADLLRNLGQVLTFASSNASGNLEQKVDPDNGNVAIRQTPKKSKLKLENKIHSSILSKSTSRLSLDSEGKKKPSTTSLLRRSTSVSHTLPLKIGQSALISKHKSTSQLKELKKRFSSDPGFINAISSKKDINSGFDGSKTTDTKKDEHFNSTSVVIGIQKEKPIIQASTVKCKLKKKAGADNKKGPMKAVLPVGNMQRMDSFSKKVSPTSSIVTPPKSHKIISSTPNSMDNKYKVKGSPRSKPVASSTPDLQNCKERKIQALPPDCLKKRNFSCDISPVTVRATTDHKGEIKNSPKKVNKLPSPKRTTPKRRPGDSNIPKSQTPPISKRMSSSFEVYRYDRAPQSPQRCLNNKSNSRQSSPIPVKKKGEKIQQSPLRDSNKLSPKVKPFNLITKLRRHSVDTNMMEKENAYT